MWKIQKYRIKSGYTQENLAEAVDLSTSYVSEIETGKKRPSMKTLEKIAAVLGVPLVALMDDGPDAEQKKGMEDFLCRKYGADQALIEIRQDASLLGGFILRAGSDEYDWSMKGRLDRLTEALAGR